jgi:hypothetical protein
MNHDQFRSVHVNGLMELHQHDPRFSFGQPQVPHWPTGFGTSFGQPGFADQYTMVGGPPAPPPGHALSIQTARYHEPSDTMLLAVVEVEQRRAGRPKRSTNLPKDATDTFKSWLKNHMHSPYPSEEHKLNWCQQTGLTMAQASIQAPFLHNRV